MRYGGSASEPSSRVGLWAFLVPWDCFVCSFVHVSPPSANNILIPVPSTPAQSCYNSCVTTLLPWGPDTEDGEDEVRPHHCDDCSFPPHRNAALIGQAVQYNYRRASRVLWEASPASVIISSAGSPALWLCISQDLYGTTQKAWWKRTRWAWDIAYRSWVRKLNHCCMHRVGPS